MLTSTSTGDASFSSDIHDLRNQFNARVILIHPKEVEDKLVRSADEAYAFGNFVSELSTEQPTCSQKNVSEEIDFNIFLSCLVIE